MKKVAEGIYLHKNKRLILCGYKEPMRLLKPSEGIGFMGALMQLEDGSEVLCNICGETFDNLGRHVFYEHGLLGREYKYKFGLAFRTPLISNTLKSNLRQISLKSVYRLPKHRLIENGAKGTAKRRRHQPKLSLETKNRRGTCPDQLLDKIKQCALAIGHTPSKQDFIKYCNTQKYTHKIYETFGSWAAALRKLGMTPRKPIWRSGITFHSKATDEMLLEYLRVFAQTHQKIPTYIDFKNSDLPTYETYIKRFGSIEIARQLSGVYAEVDTKTVELFKLKRNQSLGIRET